MADLTHLGNDGQARMVDVGAKEASRRTATASCLLRMKSSTARLIESGHVQKGEVFSIARVAGIMASKGTHQLIPLCHPLLIDSVQVHIEKWSEEDSHTTWCIRADAATHGRTGVEMEALTAVTVAALTVYDMCKSVDREMQICQVQLDEKCGGSSGHYHRCEPLTTPTLGSNIDAE